MRILKLLGLLLVMTVSIGSVVSCGDDDDDVKVSAKNICGLWYCTQQQWTEDGDTWEKSYYPSGEYCICFNEDNSGYMRSGSDELFEIGTHGTKYFTWSAKGNKVYTNVYDGQTYTVNSLNDKILVMTWRDEDYSITCKFMRADD